MNVLDNLSRNSFAQTDRLADGTKRDPYRLSKEKSLPTSPLQKRHNKLFFSRVKTKEKRGAESLAAYHCRLGRAAKNQATSLSARADEILKIFKEIEEKNLRPTLSTYAFLLDALIKADRLEDAKVFSQRIRGESIPLAAPKICNKTVQALSKLGQGEKALELFRRMEKEKIAPDRSAYCALIPLLSKAKRKQEAWELYYKMRKEKWTADVATNNALLQLLEESEAKEAWNFYKRLKEESGEANRRTYHLSLRIIGQSGTMIKEAEEIYEDFRKTMQPTLLTYNILIDVLCRAKRTEDGIKLCEQMKKVGFTPTCQTYFPLLQNMIQAGDNQEEALHLCEKLKEAPYDLNNKATTLLIRFLGKVDKIDDALAFFYRMKDSGVQPDAQAYNVLLYILGLSGETKTALKAYKEMREENIAPTTTTYNTLIDLLRKGHNEQKALEIYARMKEEGAQPDKVTYNLLIDIYLQRQDLSKAEELFNERWPEIKMRHQQGLDVLDCHSLSHGAACVMVLRYIKTHRAVSAFFVIPGQGLRSKKGVKFEMKNKILQFLADFYPMWKAYESESNPGSLFIKKVSLARANN